MGCDERGRDIGAGDRGGAGREAPLSKPPALSIRLVAGLGVVGDAHAGVTVKHRSRVRQDPSQPNLRQVHLLDAETLAMLAVGGFAEIGPGDIGENVTVARADLLALPRGRGCGWATTQKSN